VDGSGGGPPDARRRAREVEEELALHIEMRVEALVASGMAEEAARRKVMEEFGDLEAARAYCVRMDRMRDRKRRWRMAWRGIAGEARWGLRALMRRPGSAVAAAVVLMAAIALNGVVFSIVRGVLLDPLPIPEADRVVVLREWQEGQARGALGVSYPAYRAWRQESAVVERAVAYLETELPVKAEGDPLRARGATVTEGFLEFTGARLVAGRTFLPEEHGPDGPRAAVLARSLVDRLYGEDAEAPGRTLTVDGFPVRVVGVVEGGAWPEGAELWIPLETHSPGFTEIWGARVLSTLARLRPGAGPGDAARELTSISSAYPEGAGWQVRATLLREDLLRDVRTPLLLLQGAVALVLLIACANVGILLLARGLGRRGEMAVRKALGASGLRVAAGSLSEGVLLAAAAGVGGVALAWLLLDPVLALVPGDLPRASEIGMAPGVALFALGLSLLTGTLAGILPAVAGGRTGAATAIREAAPRQSGGPWARRLRDGMVVAQVGLSVVLLAGAGLLLKSFLTTLEQDPGFEPEEVVAVDLSLPPARYQDGVAIRGFVDALLERAEALPGVQSAAVGRNLPISGSDMTSPVVVEGLGADEEPAQIAWVSADYFRVMGIPLVEGRVFGPEDDVGPPVAVIDGAFRRRFLPEERSATGLRARSFFTPEMREVVGVVGSVRHRGLTSEPSPVFYERFDQDPATGFTLLLRSPRGPGGVASEVRSLVGTLDPGLPVPSVSTLEERVGRSVAGPRFYTTLVSVFAVLSLLLTVLGSYSVLAHLVGERRREIGIRMALGARGLEVRRLVLRRAIGTTGLGVVLGLAGALVATRTLEGLLFRVSPTDPWILLLLPVILLGSAVAAAWVPTRRATAVDPVRTLKEG